MFRSKYAKDLESAVEFYEKKVAELQREVNDHAKEVNQLRNIIKIKDDALAKTRGYADDLMEQLKILTGICEFLWDSNISCNDSIEFAAIKTYRDGWNKMILNGDDITPPPENNVTIWADYGERIQVETATPN